jgi:hypothetical protein
MSDDNEALRRLMSGATERLVKAGVDMGPRVTTMPDVVDVRRRRLAGPRPATRPAT